MTWGPWWAEIWLRITTISRRKIRCGRLRAWRDGHRSTGTEHTASRMGGARDYQMGHDPRGSPCRFHCQVQEDRDIQASRWYHGKATRAILWHLRLQRQIGGGFITLATCWSTQGQPWRLDVNGNPEYMSENNLGPLTDLKFVERPAVRWELSEHFQVYT